VTTLQVDLVMAKTGRLKHRQYFPDIICLSSTTVT